jgi:hypothetical protein
MGFEVVGHVVEEGRVFLCASYGCVATGAEEGADLSGGVVVVYVKSFLSWGLVADGADASLVG